MSKTMQDKETKERVQKKELKYAVLNDAFVYGKVHRWIDDVISEYKLDGIDTTSDSDLVLKRLSELRKFLFDWYSVGNGDAIIQAELKEAERRGAINILKKVRDNADELYDEERDWHEVLFGVLEAELKLLEEENGKQE